MMQTSLPVYGQLHTILQELAMFLLDFVGASLTSRFSVLTIKVDPIMLKRPPAHAWITETVFSVVLLVKKCVCVYF